MGEIERGAVRPANACRGRSGNQAAVSGGRIERTGGHRSAQIWSVNCIESILGSGQFVASDGPTVRFAAGPSGGGRFKSP